MAINRPSSGAGIWCPSCQDWAFGTPLPRTGDLVPPVRFRPRIMANLEVWYPDFCQLRRFGSSHPEKCLVAICLSGFCGYQTLRFARRRVSNLRSRHEKVPNPAILSRNGPPGYQTSQVGWGQAMCCEHADATLQRGKRAWKKSFEKVKMNPPKMLK